MVNETSIAAFEFVRELATDLSGGAVDLPSYPEVALRVQRVLADANASVDRVVRVIGSEPVLAARIMTMANSVALNPAGKQAAELRTAVARLGFDALRSAAIGFAIAQLRKAAAYREISKQMTALWQRSVSIAASCFVLARHSGKFNPDTAMLCGLVWGVGHLYILTRAAKHPALFADEAQYQSIVRDWHANVARALLENWGMAEEIIEAVHDYENAMGDTRNRAMLSDVVSTAIALVDLQDNADLMAARLQGDLAAMRLGLTSELVQSLMQESSSEVTALREALGH